MFKCNTCNVEFDIPDTVHDCLTAPFGVVRCVCPECGSDDIERADKCPGCGKPIPWWEDGPLCPGCTTAAYELMQSFLKSLSDPQLEALDALLDGESLFNIRDRELKDGV